MDRSNKFNAVSGSYRYVRIARSILPSVELESLLAVVNNEATRIFGDKAAVRRRTAPAASRPDRRAGDSNIIGIPAVRMYNSSDLSLTQLEVRVDERDVAKHAVLNRFYTKTDDIINAVPGHKDELAVAVSRLLFLYQPGQNNAAEEILLGLSMSSDAVVLDETNAIIKRLALQRGAGRELQEQFQPAALAIPVGRLPLVRADNVEHHETKKAFLEKAIAPYLPFRGVELCPITSATGTTRL